MALAPVLKELNTRLTTLYESLSSRTAILIFTGHSDPRRMAYLNAHKTAFESAVRSGKTLEEIGKDAWWTSNDGRELEEEVEKAKRGLLFLSIK
jgi:RNA exonuclease 1